MILGVLLPRGVEIEGNEFHVELRLRQARKDMAGKKIRHGRRGKIWREKRYGMAGAERYGGKKIRHGSRSRVGVGK